MASAKQQETMLLTEHFTWAPISLLDEIINSVNDVLYRCTETLEEGLLSAEPSQLGFFPRTTSSDPAHEDEKARERAKLEIEEGILKLETLMEGAVDKNFDRLEIWSLRNVLCLPRDEKIEGWLRLKHYEGLQIPDKNATLTPSSLHALRRKLNETLKLNAALSAEKARNEAQIARLRALLQPPARPKDDLHRTSSSSFSADPALQQATAAPFSFLTHTPSAQNIGIQPLPPASQSAGGTTGPTPTTPSAAPLTTHTSFTVSHLPFLRDLLALLKPHLPATALPADTMPTDVQARARERRAYIESQSKRVLEKRGVDTRDGVEGGENASGAGRVGMEEVLALEGVAGVLAGRKGVKEYRDGDGDGEAMDVS